VNPNQNDFIKFGVSLSRHVSSKWAPFG